MKQNYFYNLFQSDDMVALGRLVLALATGNQNAGWEFIFNLYLISITRLIMSLRYGLEHESDTCFYRAPSIDQLIY